MNQAKLTEVASWVGIYTRHEQREFKSRSVQYSRKKYGLFCKTRPPVSSVMSIKVSEAELGEGTVPFCKPTKKQEVLRRFWMWRLL